MTLTREGDTFAKYVAVRLPPRLPAGPPDATGIAAMFRIPVPTANASAAVARTAGLRALVLRGIAFLYIGMFLGAIASLAAPRPSPAAALPPRNATQTEYNAAVAGIVRHMLGGTNSSKGVDIDIARSRLAGLRLSLSLPHYSAPLAVPMAVGNSRAGKDLPPRRIYFAEPTPGSFIPGAGIPVVIEYNTSNPGAACYPVEGLFIAATAVCIPRTSAAAAATAAELRLIPTGDAVPSRARVRTQTVTWNGATWPVARDVTAHGFMLARHATRLKQSAFYRMLRPLETDVDHAPSASTGTKPSSSSLSSVASPGGGSAASVPLRHKQQIYLLEPYDPQKIPFLMVHGLQSTPVDFISLVNALQLDPVVRKRYQIWQFYYTSGTPVLANALLLRRSLDRIVRQLDPSDRDPATRRIVVMGHSMGGVISHTLVSGSGSKLWDSIFYVPPQQLRGNRHDIDELHNIMTFTRNPRVARAIFVSAPHRGSPIADSLAGTLGNLLIRLPAMLRTGFTAIAEANAEKMTPAALRFYRDGRFSSIRTLSPRSTALRALAEIPPAVPFHTIVGQRSAGPKETGSDGVVPYTSSHLAGAESELVVRGGHVTFRYPAAAAEIIRILHKEAGVR